MFQQIPSNVRRFRAASLAIAAAAASSAGIAHADFAYDLRFSTGSKSQAITSAGGTFTLDLWARVTGADGVHTNDGIVSGILSVQSVQVNGGALTAGGITAATPTATFAKPELAQNGEANNLTVDGIADWGTYEQWTGFPAFDRPVEHLTWYTTKTNGAGIFADIAGTTVAGSSQAVDANTWEWKVATFTVTIPVNSVGAGANAVTQFLPIFADFPAGTGAENQVVTYLQDDAKINSDYTARSNPRSPGAAVEFTIGVVGAPGWNFNGGGSWNDASKWNGGTPDAVDETAIFGASVTGPNAPASITLDGSKTVGAITFNNANTNGALPETYIIASGSGGTLSVGDAATAGTITVNAGSHRIDAALASPNNLTIITDPGTTLATTGSFSIAAGRTLTKASAGKLDVRGGLTLGNGSAIQVGAGELAVSGASTVDTAATITVAPGATLSSGGAGESFGAGSAVAAIVNNGTFTITGGAKSVGPITGAGNTSLTAGALTSGRLQQSTATIATGAKLTVRPGPSTPANLASRVASEVGTLTLTGTGVLELSNNDLVIRASDGANGIAESQQAYAQVVTGRGVIPAGAFNYDYSGPGIRATSAKAYNDTLFVDILGLSVVRNGDINTIYDLPENTTKAQGGFLYETFGGVAVTPDDTLVRFGILGDLNLDGRVTNDDYFIIDQAIGGRVWTRPGDGSVITGLLSGDVNGDGRVTNDDYFYIDQSISRTVPVNMMADPSAAGIGGGGLGGGPAGAVPEPATFSILALAATGLLGRRRRS